MGPKLSRTSTLPETSSTIPKTKYGGGGCGCGYCGDIAAGNAGRLGTMECQMKETNCRLLEMMGP